MKGIWVLLLLCYLTGKAQQPPDFTLVDTKGRSWNLYDQLSMGKTVVLDFFFVECKPCQDWTPEVNQLYSDYGGDTGSVQVLGISDRDENYEIEAFEDSLGVTYPSGGIAGNGREITNLFRNWYPFFGWPTYAVICPDTTIYWDVERSENLTILREKVDSCPASVTSAHFQSRTRSSIVYPQPASSYLVIKQGISFRGMISIFDITGKYILEKQVNEGRSMIRMDVSSLEPGMYLLVIKGNRKRSVTRFIIQ